MNPPGPDADVRPRRLPHRVAAVLLATAVLAVAVSTAGCAATAPWGQALTTTTLVTASASVEASSGPGVQPSFETGVPDAVVSFDDGLPAGAADAGERGDEVVRSADGDLLVVTWGSTTCPRMPVTVTAVDLVTIDVVTGTVRVDPARIAEVVSETALCTADLGPTVSTVRLPEGAAGAGALTVIVDGVAHRVA